MPTRVSAKILRYRKRCKMSKNSQRIIYETRNEQENYKIEQEQLQEKLRRKQNKIKERHEKKEREQEEQKQVWDAKQRYRIEIRFNRTNNWTGLRNQPKGDWERNWTTYFCLFKRFKFPKELMIPINEYLNWLPAGCWYKLDGCIECGGVIYNIDNYGEKDSTCSRRCNEAYNRFYIIENMERIYDFMQSDTDLISHLITCNYDIEKYCYMKCKNSKNNKLDKYDKENSNVVYQNKLNHQLYDEKDTYSGRCRYYEFLDNCDRYGYYYDSDEELDYRNNISINIIKNELKNLYKLILLSETNDDIWQQYRSHWSEHLIHVF